MTDPSIGCLVLCGGRSRRLGHRDKTTARLGPATVLDALLDSLPDVWPVVAVGPARPTHRTVAWAREDPVGGGPVAAISAGLEAMPAALVVVVAGDMPFAGPAAAGLGTRLWANPAVEAVVARDPDGRLQPLLAAYRHDALRRALPSPPDDAPAMRILDALVLEPLDLADPAAWDIDTPDQLEAARRRLGS